MRGHWWGITGLVVVLSIVGACAPAAPTAVPAKPTAPAATTAPAAAATTAPTTAQPAAQPTAAPSAKVKRGGKLVHAIGDEWSPSIHPHRYMGPDAGSVEVAEPFIEFKLADYKTGKFELKPLLMESWDQSDPKVVIFKLRKGVTFHDGSPWNAEAAKWNLEKMATDTKSSLRNELSGMVSTVNVVDDYTIRVDLKGPSPAFLKYVSHGTSKFHVLSKQFADQNGYDIFEKQIVGTGPFKFDKWLSGQGMWVKKWDKYYQMGEDGAPLPYLDEIETRWVKDQSVKAIEFRVGNVHVIDRLDPKDVPTLRSEPNLVLYELTWSTKPQYTFFNMDTTKKKSPWHGPYPGNVKLRQAMMYAIDKEALGNTIAPGVGKGAYWNWAPGEIGYSDALPKYDYQPEKTKQLLSEAGFPNGVDVEILSMSRQPDARVGEVMKAMMDKLNIRTTLSTLDRTAAEQAWLSGNYQYGLSGKTLGLMDPNEQAFRFKRGATKQYALAGNEEMDKCFDEAALMMDEKERGKVYERCQRLIFEEAAYDVIMQFPFIIGYNKKVQGIEAQFTDAFRHTRTWLDQ